MTRKEQNKILDAKIESNVNQYKVDRMNADISAFSSGDLNKYEFLTRIDLNYKSNVLDKARFEFSPLGKTFTMGLDKTAQGYQKEGVIKLLKYIRDGLAGGIAQRGPNLDDHNNDILIMMIIIMMILIMMTPIMMVMIMMIICLIIMMMIGQIIIICLI